MEIKMKTRITGETCERKTNCTKFEFSSTAQTVVRSVKHISPVLPVSTEHLEYPRLYLRRRFHRCVLATWRSWSRTPESFARGRRAASADRRRSCRGPCRFASRRSDRRRRHVTRGRASIGCGCVASIDACCLSTSLSCRLRFQLHGDSMKINVYRDNIIIYLRIFLYSSSLWI